MSYGLQTFNSNGGLNYTTDDVTWNQVDLFYTAVGASVTKNYPVIVGKDAKAIQVLINAPSLNSRSVAKTLTVNTTTGDVTASGGTEAAYIMVLMR